MTGTTPATGRVLPPTDVPSPWRRGVPLDLDDLAVEPHGREPATATAVLERWGSRGLVVAHRGEVVAEWFVAGHEPSRPQRCYSVTKSLIGTVLADLIVGGAVARHDVVEDVVPALTGSGFADATVGDVADMTVELSYAEDYAEIAGGSSAADGHDFGDYVVALGMEEPTAVVDPGAARNVRSLLPRIGRGAGHHGDAFHYATPVTEVAGWIIEAASGIDAVSHVSDRIWGPCGAGSAARWDLDPSGTPVVGAGLHVTTHDLARIGMLLGRCARGEGPDDAVSPAALDDARQGGSAAAFAAGGHYDYLTGYSYRNQWWIPVGPNGPISGWGIFGQFLWIDPDRDVVVACHGRGATPSDPDRDLDQHALCVAVCEALGRR
jgi:CubicO group peptidase (beta-lactamase class C family)